MSILKEATVILLRGIATAVVAIVLIIGVGLVYAAQEGGTGIGGDTFSAVTATSFIIGINTLDTTEWAFLDGQDQDVSSDATGVTFGSIDLSGGTFEVPNGTDLPGTCAIGELFVDSDDDSCADVGGGAGALCVCTAANTWTVATA